MPRIETRRVEIMSRKLAKPQPWAVQVARALEVVRCAAWFEGVRDNLQGLGTGQLSTAYAIGKHVQPHTYSGQAPNLCHNNMWSKYAVGLHCPSRATLVATESKAPGTTAGFDSPVWAMLSMANPAGSKVEEGLIRLNVGVQEALFDKTLLKRGIYRRRKSERVMLASLERRAHGLDPLAAAVLLLKEAHEAGNKARCFRIGLSLHRILLMTCVSLPVFCYRLPLIAYFSLFVFPLTASERLVIDAPIEEFYETTHLLHRFVLVLEDQGVIRCENGGSTREWRRMLEGDLGFDLSFGFMPRLKVVAGCRDPSAAGEVASQDVGKAWGLSVLRRHGFMRFPPIEIMNRMRATYEAASVSSA